MSWLVWVPATSVTTTWMFCVPSRLPTVVEPDRFWSQYPMQFVPWIVFAPDQSDCPGAVMAIDWMPKLASLAATLMVSAGSAHPDGPLSDVIVGLSVSDA